MEVRAGYKQTETGIIPEDWLNPQLQEIVENAFPICYGIVQVGRFTPNGIPVLAIKNLQTDYTSNIHRATHAIEGPYARSRIQPGDVLVSVKGTTGRIGIVPSAFVGNISRDLARLHLKSDVSPHFIYQMLQSDISQHRLENAAVGTTRMELSIAILKQVTVPLPPTLVEQEAIAGALSDADTLIESLEALIAKKRLIKQGAMQELLTGKRRLPGFTGKWEVKRLGDLFSFNGGFTASRDQLTAEGYCYLHYGDIHKSNKAYIDVCGEYTDIPKLNVPLGRVETRSLLNDGDVVFVDASEDDDGASKHIVVINKDKIPFISGLHTIVAKGKADDLVHEYRRYCFQTSAIREQFLFYSVGTKVTGISKSNIAKLLLPLPSTSEQSAIAAVISDMDEEIAALEARLSKARLIKQGMMQELLTGRIRLV